MIADITEHEIDLIEIGKMIDDFGPVVVAALAGFVAEVIEKMALALVNTAAKILRLCIVRPLTGLGRIPKNPIVLSAA